MQCVREHNGVLPPPHIFFLLSQGGEGEAPPQKGDKGGSHPLPPPRDLDFSPSDEVAGHKLLGSRDSLVVVFLTVEINSEQNRLSPPPLTLNDESEGIFLFVVK